MQAGVAGCTSGRTTCVVKRRCLCRWAHIDHQLGIITGMTIDQSVMLAFAPADESQSISRASIFRGVSI